MTSLFRYNRPLRALVIIAAGAVALCAFGVPRPQLNGGGGPAQPILMNPTVNLKLPEQLDFCGEPVPLHAPHVRMQAEREFYLMLQDPGQLIINIKRSGIFFPLFEAIAKQDSVPDDLKYIAVIESALRNARSPKDAFGIWQFIEPTGKRFGLQIDKDVDERLNLVKATHAAYAHMREGHDMLRSWTMGAAGYNMGPANLAEQATYQRDSNFYNLYLNEETTRYIFRASVMKELMSHHDAYGIHLTDDEIYHPDTLKVIPVDGAIADLQEWAVQNGTTYKWVKIYNPWILKRALPRPKSGSVWEIIVPVF